jgi:hypothetical protein
MLLLLLSNLVLLGKTLQKASDSIVEAFTKIQPDPTHAAKIKDLAKRLQAIRDRDHTLP